MSLLGKALHSKSELGVSALNKLLEITLAGFLHDDSAVRVATFDAW